MFQARKTSSTSLLDESAQPVKQLKADSLFATTIKCVFKLQVPLRLRQIQHRRSIPLEYVCTMIAGMYIN